MPKSMRRTIVMIKSVLNVFLNVDDKTGLPIAEQLTTVFYNIKTYVIDFSGRIPVNILPETRKTSIESNSLSNP